MDRTSLYHDYRKQKERDDDEDIGKLMAAHIKNPRYGVRRLAIELQWSEDKTRRIRNLAGVEALRKTKRRRNDKTLQKIDSPENKLRNYWKFKDPNNPRDGYDFSDLTNPELNIWAEDFTYIGWKGRFLYLVAHSDQGSEYLSRKKSELCEQMNIEMSASDKGKPWQNGFMERFFATFKEEMEHKIRNCKTITEAYEKIANWIYYYNYERIHTALKMPPTAYALKLREANLLQNTVKKVPKMNASHSLRLPQSAYDS